jgi:putative photosynthetic complex assembly protein
MTERSISTQLVSRPQVEGWPLAALAVLVLGSIVLAGFGQWQKRQQAELPVLAVLETRSLVFLDGPGGDVLIRDAVSGEQLPPITGEAGFARGVLRSLAQARLRAGGGAEQPFVLNRQADDRLILADPVTGRQVDLATFGPTNVAVFQPLLEVRTSSSSGESR